MKNFLSILFSKFKGKADYDSALPIRSEADGADERVQVKIVDGTTPTQKATVGTDGNLHVEVHGDNPSAGDETLRLSELGAPNPDGDYDGTNNTKPANIGLIVHDRNATPADAQQNLRVTGVQGATDTTHWSMDVALHTGDGDIIDSGNPLPVYMTQSLGAEVFDYKKAAAVAKDASDTHTYTVTAAKTLNLHKIQASASGKIKVVVKWGTPSSEVEKIVMFNSTANPNVEYVFVAPQTVAAEDNVLVIITNLDNSAQDVYSVIEGAEVSA